MHRAIVLMLLLVLPGAGGCAWVGWPTTYSRYARDVKPEQPWIGPDARAKSYVSTMQSWAWASNWLEWADAKEKLVARSDEVIQKSDEWLSSQPAAGAFSPTEVVITNPRYVDSWETVPLKTHGFPKVRVIVCVRPIVVVTGPGPIGDHSFRTIALGDQTERFSPAGKLAIEVALRPKQDLGVALGKGYDYGTEVPFEPEATWFSPDLKLGPRSAEVVSEGVRRIPVPWGNLILTRDGNKWVVSAEAAANLRP